MVVVVFVVVVVMVVVVVVVVVAAAAAAAGCRLRWKICAALAARPAAQLSAAAVARQF